MRVDLTSQHNRGSANLHPLALAILMWRRQQKYHKRECLVLFTIKMLFALRSSVSFVICWGPLSRVPDKALFEGSPTLACFTTISL